MERRARAKRRNTVIGACVGTLAVIVILVIIGIVIFGGSSKQEGLGVEARRDADGHAVGQPLDAATAGAEEVRQDLAEPACQGRPNGS